MKRLLGLSAAACGLLVSASGSAATVPVSVVVDINSSAAKWSLGGSSLLVQAAKLAQPGVTIHDGDTLQYTITFAGNESITVSDADSFTVSLGSNSASTNTRAIGKLTLLGANVTSAETTTNTTASASGSVDAVTQFSTLPDPVTFTGLYWEGTIDYTSFANSLNTARTFDAPSFTVSGNFISTAGSVPEPASWAMMVIGFGAVGAGLRSRRASVKFA